MKHKCLFSLSLIIGTSLGVFYAKADEPITGVGDIQLGTSLRAFADGPVQQGEMLPVSASVCAKTGYETCFKSSKSLSVGGHSFGIVAAFSNKSLARILLQELKQTATPDSCKQAMAEIGSMLAQSYGTFDSAPWETRSDDRDATSTTWRTTKMSRENGAGLTLSAEYGGDAETDPLASCTITVSYALGQSNQTTTGGQSADRDAPITSPKGTRYSLTDCGSIMDRRTQLEWYIGPDVNTSWESANKWVRSLVECAGGWTIPTNDQLKTLFDLGYTAGTGYYTRGKYWPAHIDPAFSQIGDGSWVWTRGTPDAQGAPAFNFNQGVSVRLQPTPREFTVRTFAVRRASENIVTGSR
jgi:hypothetical protein